MSDKTEPTPKAIRKLNRRTANEKLTKAAKSRSRPQSAEQFGDDRPVNRQAATDPFDKLDWDGSFDYKKERSRDRAP